MNPLRNSFCLLAVKYHCCATRAWAQIESQKGSTKTELNQAQLVNGSAAEIRIDKIRLRRPLLNRTDMPNHA